MTRKFIFIVLLACIIISNAFAQSLTLESLTHFQNSSFLYINETNQDSAGNIYVAGGFVNTVDFDPGPGVFNLTANGSNGLYDVFFGKYNSLGELIWVKSFGSSADETVHEMIFDKKGFLYLTGGFHFTVDFDPNAGTTSYTADALNDVYIAKYDTSGNLIWAKAFGGSNEDIGRALVVDELDNVYVTGSFCNTIFIGSDVLNAPGSSTSFNIFICKLDQNGNYIWAKSIGDSYHDIGYKIKLDSDNNLIVAGQFTGSANFDTGGGFTILSSLNTTRDLFIAKYDTACNLIDVKQVAGGDGDENVTELKIMPDHSVALIGYSGGMCNFDPNMANNHIMDESGYFLLVLDNILNYQWSSKYIEGTPITFGADSQNRINLVGNYSTSFLVESNSVYTSFQVGGYADMFVVRYDINGNIIAANHCSGAGIIYPNSIFMDSSDNIFIGGRFIGTEDFDFSSDTSLLTSASNMDSFLAKYNICNQLSGTSVQNISGCDSVEINNYKYFISGQYQQFLENTSSCDSIIVLNMTISHPSESYNILSACNQYTSPSGNYIWTTNGFYVDTILNTAGCDSIITINLTINSVDTSIWFSSNLISANQGGATYQWLDCNNSYSAINGETGQYFYPNAAANIAVEITYNGCTDTSSCYTIIGIEEINDFGDKLTVYPNPTIGNLSIDLGDSYELISVKVFNILSEMVLTNNFYNTNKLDINLNSSNGLYLVEVTTSANKKAIFRIVKQ